MIKIYISLGSNFEPQKNLQLAITYLRHVFLNVKLSSCYLSPDKNGVGDDFINLVACADTDLSLDDTIMRCKNIEKICHKEKTAKGANVDLDLLIYGDCIDEKLNIPRKNIEKYAFIIAPLLELEAGIIDPKTKTEYSLISNESLTNNNLIKLSYKFK